ncbi:MAG: hypothetical protein QOJ76_1093 [Acidobacteriota bacterium]|nr:hypothetical protein [Acidobacteriota bacterium]
MPVPVYFYLLLPLLENDLRDGVLGGVREREVRVGCAQRDEEFACVAGELKERRAGVGRGDFDVMPGEAVAPAGLKRLEGGLFGGEARGVVLRRRRAARVAVGALKLRKDALAKARRTREHFTHAADFDNVYADGDDHD